MEKKYAWNPTWQVGGYLGLFLKAGWAMLCGGPWEKTHDNLLKRHILTIHVLLQIRDCWS